MRAEILYRPSYSMAVVDLEPYEEIRVEAGSMVSMTEGITLQTKAEGGLLKSLSRSLLGGEGFFVNVFRAPDYGGQINLAPELPGDMMILDLRGESILTQGGSHISSDAPMKIELSSKAAKLDKEKLTLADSVTKKEAGKEYVDPKFEVPFVVAAAGKASLEAKMTFFICTDKVCARQQKTLSIPVEAN